MIMPGFCAGGWLSDMGLVFGCNTLAVNPPVSPFAKGDGKKSEIFLRVTVFSYNYWDWFLLFGFFIFVLFVFEPVFGSLSVFLFVRLRESLGD